MAHDATAATCDNHTLVFHRHRARSLLRAAYALENTKPDHSLIRAAQDHRRCIHINEVRLAIGTFRDRVKERWEASHTFGSIDPPGASYLAGLRACESGGDYSTNTGNGYYGAYQFDPGTWASVGGSGNPAEASPAEQDYRAALLWRQRGSAPWPVCG